MRVNLSLIIIEIIIVYSINLANAQQCTSRYQPYYNGSCTVPSDCQGALLNNLCPSGLRCCITDYSYEPQTFISYNQLKNITGLSNPRIEYVSKILRPPSANPTCNQKAAFVSQLAHESANFVWDEEIGQYNESYFDRYENRTDIGNNQPGDGRKYRGRGFIQLTGRGNYNKAGQFLGIDLVNNPELAAFPSVASKIAVWYWTSGSNVNLNTIADGTFYNYSIITQKINGQIRGLLDRTNYLLKAMAQFGCGELVKGRGSGCIPIIPKAVCVPMCVSGLDDKNFCGCKGSYFDGLCNGVPSNIKCCIE